MNKPRLFCLTLIISLMLPYVCYAQDASTDGAPDITASTEPAESIVTAGEDWPVTPIVPEFEGAFDWAVSELTQAYEFGLTTERAVTGMSSPITREEFCELAVLFYEKYSGREAGVSSKNPFTDTNNPNIMKAVALGITYGSTPTCFAPFGHISKQDMVVMIVRAMNSCGIDISVTTAFDKFTDSNKIGSHALSSVEALQERGILKGVASGTSNGVIRYKLDPLGNISRQEAIILLKRTFEYAVMVRNASKWGPDVYIPQLEFGDGFIMSSETLTYENEFFDLVIKPGTPVDVDFEQRMHDIFKCISEITGFKNPPGKKILIYADINSEYGSGVSISGTKYINIIYINSTHVLSPVDNDPGMLLRLIQEVFHCLRSNYPGYGFVIPNTILTAAMCDFTSDRVESECFESEYININHYKYWLLNSQQKQRFESELDRNAEECFLGLDDLKLSDLSENMDYFQDTYYLLFEYINDVYGPDVIRKCISEILEYAGYAFGDFDVLIDSIKSLTDRELFSDFKDWYYESKTLYDFTIARDVRGVTEPLCIERENIERFHPKIFILKDDYHDKNTIYYFTSDFHLYSYKFVGDTLTFDYSTAIAMSQINGLDIKGISLSNQDMDKYSALGLTYEVYGANGDIIFEGPCKKTYPGIASKNGYMIFYGGVKIVYHAPPGTVIYHQDGSEVTSELLVRQ